MYPWFQESSHTVVVLGATLATTARGITNLSNEAQASPNKVMDYSKGTLTQINKVHAVHDCLIYYNWTSRGNF